MIVFRDKVYETCEEEPKKNDLVIDGYGDVGYLDFIQDTPIIKDTLTESTFMWTYCINPKKLEEVIEE